MYVAVTRVLPRGHFLGVFHRYSAIPSSIGTVTVFIRRFRLNVKVTVPGTSVVVNKTSYRLRLLRLVFLGTSSSIVGEFPIAAVLPVATVLPPAAGGVAVGGVDVGGEVRCATCTGVVAACCETPEMLVAVTTTRTYLPAWASVGVYFSLVAPGMSVQSDPSASAYTCLAQRHA